MAKQRNVIGSIVKSKPDDKGKVGPDYIKLRDGKTYRLESKAYRLQSLEDSVKNGKLSAEVAEEIKAKIEKTPDFVRFEIVEYVEKADKQ